MASLYYIVNPRPVGNYIERPCLKKKIKKRCYYCFESGPLYVSPNWPGIHYVVQAGLEFTELRDLPLLPECWDLKMYAPCLADFIAPGKAVSIGSGTTL